MHISPKFTVKEWRALSLVDEGQSSHDWGIAVKILRDRIEGRFLTPARHLQTLQEDAKFATYGFAILALDCVVIETIEGFRAGLVSHKKESQKLFVSFAKNWPEFNECCSEVGSVEKKADSLYSGLRCALHHSGKTDGLKVDRIGPMVSFKSDKLTHINRNRFHEGVAKEVDRYFELLLQPASIDLRKKCKAKMDNICAT